MEGRRTISERELSRAHGNHDDAPKVSRVARVVQRVRSMSLFRSSARESDREKERVAPKQQTVPPSILRTRATSPLDDRAEKLDDALIRSGSPARRQLRAHSSIDLSSQAVHSLTSFEAMRPRELEAQFCRSNSTSMTDAPPSLQTCSSSWSSSSVETLAQRMTSSLVPPPQAMPRPTTCARSALAEVNADRAQPVGSAAARANVDNADVPAANTLRAKLWGEGRGGEGSLPVLSPTDEVVLAPLAAHLGIEFGTAGLLALNTLPLSSKSLRAHAEASTLAAAPAPPPLEPAPLADAQFRALAYLLTHERCSLASLAFARADLTAQARVAMLSTALISNMSLTTLDLRGQGIGANGAAELSRVLVVPGLLRSLDLYGNAVRDGGVLALAGALERAGPRSALRTLDLGANELGDDGARVLAECRCMQLEELRLYANGLSHRGAVLLAGSLESHASLTCLDLQGNAIGDVGTAALAHALRINRLLLTLGLRGCELADMGASALAAALRVNTTLTALDLFANAVADGGCSDLADALCVNSSLAELELDANRFCAIGAASLGSMLQVNRGLRSLALSSSAVGNEGMAFLADALPANDTLCKLILRGDKPRPEGVAALAGMLRERGNGALTELDLDYAQVGDVGARALAEAIGASNGSSLRALVMCAHGLSAIAIDALSDAFLSSPSLTRLDLLEPKGLGARPGEPLSQAIFSKRYTAPDGYAWHADAMAELVSPGGAVGIEGAGLHAA